MSYIEQRHLAEIVRNWVGGKQAAVFNVGWKWFGWAWLVVDLPKLLQPPL